MVLNLGLIFRTHYAFHEKRIDIVELGGRRIRDCLEAKHYTPHQDNDLMYYLFNSAGGTASDTLKLKTLGFGRFFIVQFTSQITDITGTDNQILTLANTSRYTLLKYLFDKGGSLLRSKITTPVFENWSSNLLDFFGQIFDSKTLYGSISGLAAGSSSVTIKLVFHYYIMEIDTNQSMIINRYPR